MRHKKKTCKLNRTTSHRRCMFANMMKALITHGKIETTIPKAKALRSYADKMITLAKENTLATRRRAIAQMMITFNKLTSKEERVAKTGKNDSYNDDRFIIDKLFSELGPRFSTRAGGYTRITKSSRRSGDNTQTCFIEYLEN